jgi:membrane-bound serine protease (ClpP class)
MRKEMRATAEAKGRRGDVAEAMVDADLEVPGLDEKGKLLTLDGRQAIAWGIAELEAQDVDDLVAKLGVEQATIQRPELSWAEQLARFLSDPIFSGILMTLGMLGILIELYSPGHGVALGFGLVCLGLFFFGHHVVKLAGWEEIGLFVVGVTLVGVEVFVPGHVLPGVVGALCIVGSLVFALVNLEAVPVEVAWRAGWLTRALAIVMGSVLATALCGWGLVKLLPRTPFGRPLVLEATLPPGPALLPAPGQTGRADTPLRPSGKVIVDGRRLDAVAEVGFLEAGTAIRVVRSEAGRVVVRAERS